MVRLLGDAKEHQEDRGSISIPMICRYTRIPIRLDGLRGHRQTDYACADAISM